MTVCKITGYACNCQPDEGIPCNGVERLRESYNEWRTRAERMEGERDQLRGNLSLAEEGLANYAQEVERISTLLGMVAVHLEHPEIGGLSESQKLAISEWYEVFRENRVGVPQPGEQT